MATHTIRRSAARGKICSKDGCSAEAHARGFCEVHYRHARRGGMALIQPPVRHFWDAVRKTPNEDDCWEWGRSRVPSGYGKIYHKGKTTPSHRVAWVLTNGPIPEGLEVLHRCDNPPCCNPKHLFLGTQSDNMRDRAAKKRDNPRRGEDNGAAKIREFDVRRMIRLHELGVTLFELSRIYGIVESRVLKIINRKAWDHVDV